MYLATAFTKKVAIDFMKRVPEHLVPVLFIFQLDPEFTCDHALYLDDVTLVPGEGEFLYVPFSVFTPVKIAIPEGEIRWSNPAVITLPPGVLELTALPSFAFLKVAQRQHQPRLQHRSRLQLRAPLACTSFMKAVLARLRP